ncbi:MAG TPA: hypothetical protein H9955_10035 [Candidatus Mediterraneibacter cottocaccae]|nr:hypothetical protein [Candidatus Mediterraneibacter cottocaccae]
MRHFYTRLTLGIVFLVCLVFSIITLNIPFALLYVFLSAAMLLSAHSLWEKGRDDQSRDDQNRDRSSQEKNIQEKDSRR